MDKGVLFLKKHARIKRSLFYRSHWSFSCFGKTYFCGLVHTLSIRYRTEETRVSPSSTRNVQEVALKQAENAWKQLQSLSVAIFRLTSRPPEQISIRQSFDLKHKCWCVKLFRLHEEIKIAEQDIRLCGRGICHELPYWLHWTIRAGEAFVLRVWMNSFFLSRTPNSLYCRAIAITSNQKLHPIIRQKNS